MALSYWDRNYAQRVYQRLLSEINNPYGVSGLMGNLYAESAICPFRCEGDNYAGYQDSYNSTINIIRNLSEDDFCRFRIYGTLTAQQNGYSLAQWTWPTAQPTAGSRKANYYNFCGQSLLGDEDKSIDFLIYELKSSSYSYIFDYLVNCTSVNDASDYVLRYYEVPADWESKVSERRNYSIEVYNDFSGLPPIGSEDLAGALSLGASICWDEEHGYVMGANMNPDTDCSGFIGYCLKNNGFNVDQRWNTTSMIPALMDYPGFQHFIYSDGFNWQHGDIAVYDEGGGINGHTFFYVENIRGYLSNDPINGDGTTGILSRARMEASSDRGRSQTGDQDNGHGMHPEVWIHPFSFTPGGHTWHIFRWTGGSPSGGSMPPWLMAKNSRYKVYGSYPDNYYIRYRY